MFSGPLRRATSGKIGLWAGLVGCCRSSKKGMIDVNTVMRSVRQTWDGPFLPSVTAPRRWCG